MVTWSECSTEFASDGSLRDVYIVGGGLEAWEVLLAIARRYSARFSVEGIPMALPESARDAFAQSAGGTALLSVDWRGIEFAAHFFDEADVELDFVPNVLSGQASLDNLCSFVQELAIGAKRDVIVTPENGPQSPILRARPTGDVVYESPKDAA